MANASVCIVATFAGIVTEVRPVQPLNAEAPIIVIVEGIVTEVNPVIP